MINEVTGEMIQQKWHLFVLVPEKPGHQEAELCCDVMQLLLTSPYPGESRPAVSSAMHRGFPLAQYISNPQILCRCKL